ncbi:PepSY domain-containing protein [Caulobacter sp. FWC2]|uniref:PepSY-associated TM helix domain-containing protein n=1 Tax=Caulobacter sp. FWC2 TaxID=69664 RepID=UPI000C15B45E|nr:PepSY-associated TM helix domain-containing protein [Caulobacter sp. FWC2]PIB91581.1 peptidase [Caulobacter sp. FWC2]
MKGGFRQSMAWLHTWSGLVVGWILLAIFTTGTAAYFQEEITRWMQPEITAAASPEIATQNAIAFLQRTSPNAQSWFISVPGRRSAATQVYWQSPAHAPATGRQTEAILDGDGREVTTRATQGGFFLYRFHFDLHYLPVMWARYIVGACAMVMLVAILSGVVTHKKIFVDFFTLRFGKGQRSWLDAHNVTAVLALPFYLMITYTGLVTLDRQYMPFGVAAVYKDRATFFDQAFPSAPPVERVGRSVAQAPLAPMFETARSQWNGAGIGYVSITNPGDANARVSLTRSSNDRMANRGETLVFDGISGALLASPNNAGAAAKTESVMIGLHAGRYARSLLRWLYFLSGLGGATMIATGLVLWTVKRRGRLADPAKPHFGFSLVERLNIATIAGLPAGIAVYFLANRLLPLQMPRRADWEVDSLFIAWGAVLVWTLTRPAKRAWVEALGAAAILFAAVPVVNALTTPRNLFASLMRGDRVFAGFDLTLLVLAGLIGWAAWKAHTHKPKAAAKRPAKGREAVAA